MALASLLLAFALSFCPGFAFCVDLSLSACVCACVCVCRHLRSGFNLISSRIRPIMPQLKRQVRPGNQLARPPLSPLSSRAEREDFSTHYAYI